MLIYDIEIANPIAPSNPADRRPNLFYAKSFEDFGNMGIAVIACYEYTTDKYSVFGEYELEDFQKILDVHDVAVGYNNIRFDNNLLRACNVKISDSKSYDILSHIYTALGSRQKGCKLDDVIKANFPSAGGKNGSGADAPILWQNGYHTRVINYCLNDVRLTKMILDRIIRNGWIRNPIAPERVLKMKRP